MTIADWFRSQEPPVMVNTPEFELMCRVRPRQFDHLTLLLQSALVGRGARIATDGMWTDETCAAWWREMDEPLSVEAVAKLWPELGRCRSMQLPSCPKPGLSVERVLQIALFFGIAYAGVKIAQQYQRGK